MKEETRSARLSLVMTPTMKEKLFRISKMNGQSANDFIVRLLDEHVAQNEVAIEKLETARQEFEQARRAIAEKYRLG